MLRSKQELIFEAMIRLNSKKDPIAVQTKFARLEAAVALHCKGYTVRESAEAVGLPYGTLAKYVAQTRRGKQRRTKAMILKAEQRYQSAFNII